MNRIKVKITEVSSSGGVILVDMVADGHPMSALLIDAGEKPGWLKKDNFILAIFKETEVSIAKNFSGNISLRNKLPCVIKSINRGELMSTVSLQFMQFSIHSAITTRSLDSLELTSGDEVTALIKANEITLMNI